MPRPRRDGTTYIRLSSAVVSSKVLKPEEGSLDHVVPRSRGGKDAWENLVWSSKAVNAKKGNRLP